MSVYFHLAIWGSDAIDVGVPHDVSWEKFNFMLMNTDATTNMSENIGVHVTHVLWDSNAMV